MSQGIELNFVKSKPEGDSGVFGRPVFALGFRPFFLLGALLAAAFLVIWLFAYTGKLDLNGYAGSIAWHSHEMLFGFTLAIIAGFLLTAVQNWTSVPMPKGGVLAGLVGLWVLGRVAMVFAGSLPAYVVFAADMLFLPLLAVSIALPIIKSKNKRNLVFVPIFIIFTLANLGFHLDATGLVPGIGAASIQLALNVIVAVMVLIGGRVIPFFTRNATGLAIGNQPEILGKLALGSVFLVLALDVFLFNSMWVGIASLVAGTLCFARMWGWNGSKTFKNSLLWVLHIGYGFIALGLVLRGLALIPVTSGLVPVSASTHALTAGAIGTLTLGMMARVSLGHTGRPLVVKPIMSWMFGVVIVGALLRVAAPIFLKTSSLYIPMIVVAGSLWSVTFLVFFIVYFKILMTVRPDGRAG